MPHRSPTDPESDPAFNALAQAFGGQAGDPPATVLQVLRSRTGVGLDLHLDGRDDDESPVSVTEETKGLRDRAGRYQMLGEIGRGGVGVVYKGRDTDLGRDVAMKVLKEDYADSADLLARFVEEAQIGGQLQHPGIVPVYELGLQESGRPYFAMKLVKGETLAVRLARRGDPSKDRRALLGVFEHVCQAMAYAHTRNVIHRDLKPGNVMIGAFGEVQVVDWGLAKVLPTGGVADEEASVLREEELSVIETLRSGSGSHSIAGSRIGTPAYMPPEQAQGQIDWLDTRSDVFGLGAILCEILTGAPPYRRVQGDVLRQAAMAALDGAYERLAQCAADEALVALCVECLARTQDERPASAAEVAERIGAYLTSVEERAHAAELEATAARVRVVAERKARRLTLALALSGVALIAVVAGVYVRGVQREEARIVLLRARLDDARQVALAYQADGELDLALVEARKARKMAETERADETSRAQAVELHESIGAAAEKKESTAGFYEDLKAVQALEYRTVRDLPDEREAIDAGFAVAFRDLGLDLEGEDSDAAIEYLQEIGIAEEVGMALDEWARLRRGLPVMDPQEVEMPTLLASYLDPSETRHSLRDALLARDEERLSKLASEEECLESPSTLVVLIEALRELGFADQAKELAERATELHPDDFRLRWSAGWWLYGPDWNDPNWWGKRRRDLALPHFVAALALRREDPAVLMMVARMEFEMGEIVAARAHLQAVVDRDGQIYRAWGSLAQCELKLGDFEAMLRTIRRALGAWPQDVKLLSMLSLARHLTGKITVDEFTAEAPAGMQAWAICMLEQPGESQVLAAWDRLESRPPEQVGPAHWLTRSIVALRLGRHAEALQSIAAFGECDEFRKPLDLAALEFVAAMARARLGEDELARERYDRGRQTLAHFAVGREQQLARSFAARLGEEARVALGL